MITMFSRDIPRAGRFFVAGNSKPTNWVRFAKNPHRLPPCDSPRLPLLSRASAVYLQLSLTGPRKAEPHRGGAEPQGAEIPKLCTRMQQTPYLHFSLQLKQKQPVTGN